MRAPPSPELADVIAYVEQRRDNCAVMAARWPEFAEAARAMRRQCDVFLSDLRAGLHEGSADVRARLGAAGVGPCGTSAAYPFTGHHLEEVDSEAPS